jgi:UDP-N-acetylmuramate dehydrogenase
MEIEFKKPLLPYNTFGIDSRACFFGRIAEKENLLWYRNFSSSRLLILGGGSNLLLPDFFEGIVLKNEIKGIRVQRVFKNRVWIEAGAGENWHDLVLWCVQNGYGGIENLSLIPGTVGAAPIQNIGAYGVELKDVFVKLEAFDLEQGVFRTFFSEDCAFGYRDSFFKNAGKNRFVITSVVLSLTQSNHRLNLAYGDIRTTLEKMGVSSPSIADISNAVIKIRQSKLPDPAILGNCGSFFKNPVIPSTQAARLRSAYPEVPMFDLPDGTCKVPAGWLIEQCGWKGKKVGNTGAYEKQALVLVNYGGATAAEVNALVLEITQSVQKKFGIILETEVNIL